MSPEPVKSLPLTEEVVAALKTLSQNARRKVNGGKFGRAAAVQAYHTASALERYARYGSGCPSTMWHGPGHQSACTCQLDPGHAGKHRGAAMGETWQWEGLVFFGGHDRERVEVAE